MILNINYRTYITVNGFISPYIVVFVLSHNSMELFHSYKQVNVDSNYISF